MPVCQTALPCQLCSAPGWNEICCRNSFLTNGPFPCFLAQCSRIFPCQSFFPKINGIKKRGFGFYLWAVTSRMSVWGTAWVNSIEVLRTSYSWRNVYNSSNQKWNKLFFKYSWHQRNVVNSSNQSEMNYSSDKSFLKSKWNR